MQGDAFDVTYMPSYVAVRDLPYDRDSYYAWDVILISDIGSNSILLPPEVFIKSERRPNRLKLLRDWTYEGGGLMMVGGYLTFQDIEGRGRWHRTPVKDALPVTCHAFDDRLEIPEGFTPEVTGAADHPILKGVPQDWPYIIGANEIVLKKGADVLARFPEEEGGHPLLVAAEYGDRRSIAWASDMPPHWLPPEFFAWEGYGIPWRNMLRWLAKDWAGFWGPRGSRRSKSPIHSSLAYPALPCGVRRPTCHQGDRAPEDKDGDPAELEDPV